MGWRPAVGQEVPNTPWVLEEKLGEGGFGEVWRGRHRKLKEDRVFKFCFRADRVRSLKREMTLFRLLKERVGEHPNIVRLHEVYLEQPPYYLEEDYVPGKDLRTWCEGQGGIEKVPLETRLELWRKWRMPCRRRTTRASSIATSNRGTFSLPICDRQFWPS